MDRYKTRWYVTTDPGEAARLAEIDHTPAGEIEVTHNVEPVHVQGWILWSDNQFTTGIGSGLPRGGNLTPDAAKLISLCRASDTGSVEGGLISLTQVKRIVAEAEIECGPSRGHYAPESITRLDIEWLDGSEHPLYQYSVGYFEGYAYDLYQSLEALRTALTPAPPVTGIMDFAERGYRYDARLGWVKDE